MEVQQLISELRNALQATVSTDEFVNDVQTRVTKPVITDEAQRAILTAKYVALLEAEADKLNIQ